MKTSCRSRARETGRRLSPLSSKKFLSTLTEEELRAGIAHELRHVWIFSSPLRLPRLNDRNQVLIRLGNEASSSLIMFLGSAGLGFACKMPICEEKITDY